MSSAKPASSLRNLFNVPSLNHTQSFSLKDTEHSSALSLNSRSQGRNLNSLAHNEASISRSPASVLVVSRRHATTQVSFMDLYGSRVYGMFYLFPAAPPYYIYYKRTSFPQQTSCQFLSLSLNTLVISITVLHRPIVATIQ